MIINDLDGCYIVFDTKNRNMELDTLWNKVSYVDMVLQCKVLIVPLWNWNSEYHEEIKS